MLKKIYSIKKMQLVLGLLSGIVFGFLLQKGGVNRYDKILGQLLLIDFTVVKVMLSAIASGMVGIYLLKSFGLVKLQPKAGSVGMNVLGGMFFGIAFALLGYCPGTAVGAIGNGYLDALLGGITGMVLGSGIYASIYPRFSKVIVRKGNFGAITFPELLKSNQWLIVAVFFIFIVLILFLLETFY